MAGEESHLPLYTEKMVQNKNQTNTLNVDTHFNSISIINSDVSMTYLIIINVSIFASVGRKH